MKIRNGFVSNSSSSSFIIAFKDSQDICPHCGRKDKDVLNFLERPGYYDNEIDAIGYDKVLENMDWIYSKDEIIERMKQYKDSKDYKLAYIRVSYHDEDTLEELKSNKNINILWQCGD